MKSTFDLIQEIEKRGLLPTEEDDVQFVTFNNGAVYIYWIDGEYYYDFLELKDLNKENLLGTIGTQHKKSVLN